MAHIMQVNFSAESSNDWTDGPRANSPTSTFTVYTNNPYTLHLEIDETNTSEETEQLNGDGGASLNAYAACLTLKVIF
jgi:hypothetical protein